MKKLAQLRGEERKEILIRGAMEEGTLSFYTSTAPEDVQSLLLAFGMRYPFIQPEIVRDVARADAVAVLESLREEQ